MQLNRPDVDGRNFERQTKLTDAAAAATGGDVGNEEEGGDEGPAPSAELGRAADAGEPQGAPCCVAARTGLRLAAAAQLGLAAAAVLCVAPSWPSRSQLLAWKSVVLLAAWLPAALESRPVAALSFFALCAGTASLLLLWAGAQAPRVLCDQAYADSGCAGGRDDCCYRCDGFPSGTAGVGGWEASCVARMVAAGRLCWYPEWCDSDAVGAAFVFGGASSFNAAIATFLCWCQWTVLAPRTKVENVEARQGTFAGRSMLNLGKSMSQMPSFLFRPQKAGGAMQQPRVAAAPGAATADAAPTPAASEPPPKKKKKKKPGKRESPTCRHSEPGSRVQSLTAVRWYAAAETDVEMLARAARLGNRVEQAEMEKAQQATPKVQREDHKGPEGMQLQISATTGSIVMPTDPPSSGASASAAKKGKREKRERKQKGRSSRPSGDAKKKGENKKPGKRRSKAVGGDDDL